MFPDVEGWLERKWPLGWRIYRLLQRVDLGFMASSVAFQAFLSLLPLFVVVYLLVAILAGQRLATEVLVATEGLLPDETRRLLAGAVTGEIAGTATSAISLAILLWGAIGLFATLKTAFATIYDAEEMPSLVAQVANALVAFAVILVAVTAAVATVSVGVFSTVPFAGLLASALFLVVLVLAFVPTYYLFPTAPTSLRDALPGAVVAAVGLALLQGTFQLYLRVAGPTIAGALGAILVLLTWLYLGSYVVLFGAVVNASLSDRVEPIERRTAHDVEGPGRPTDR